MAGVHNPRIVIGSAALTGLTLLGGVGTAMGNDTATGSGPRPAGIDVAEVATSSAVADDSGLSQPNTDHAAVRLLGMLPAGYDSTNCSAAAEGIGEALVTLDCGQNLQPNGPTSARFALFDYPRAMEYAFVEFASRDRLSRCPNAGESPGFWSYNASDDKTAGQNTCGSNQGTPTLTWTQDEQVLLARIQGNDINSLYNYWSHTGGSGNGAPGRHA